MCGVGKPLYEQGVGRAKPVTLECDRLGDRFVSFLAAFGRPFDRFLAIFDSVNGPIRRVGALPILRVKATLPALCEVRRLAAEEHPGESRVYARVLVAGVLRVGEHCALHAPADPQPEQHG